MKAQHLAIGETHAKDSLIELASEATKSFTIVTPFIDIEGVEWITQLFGATGGREISRTLIARGRESDVEVLRTRQSEFRNLRTRILSYAVIHAPRSRALTIETFRFKDRVGGLDRVATVLAELEEKIDPAKLAAAAEQVEERAHSQRRGYLLELVGKEAAPSEPVGDEESCQERIVSNTSVWSVRLGSPLKTAIRLPLYSSRRVWELAPDVQRLAAEHEQCSVVRKRRMRPAEVGIVRIAGEEVVAGGRG